MESLGFFRGGFTSFSGHNVAVVSLARLQLQVDKFTYSRQVHIELCVNLSFRWGEVRFLPHPIGVLVHESHIDLPGYFRARVRGESASTS